MNEESDFEMVDYDPGNPLAAALDESSPNEYREAALKANKFYDRGIAYVNAHRKNFLLTWDCWLLAMEKYDLLGVDNQVDLAARHNVTKQDVGKIVNQIQHRIEMRPSPNQRKQAGRKNMSESRKAQLK